MESANEKQVGGEHYRAEIQHWDFVELNGLRYLEGCASKYITRHRKKNGVEDLDKAIHYVEKLIEMHKTGKITQTRGFMYEPKISVVDFVNANGLNDLEGESLYCLMYWREGGELLHHAIQLIEKMKMQAAT